MVVNSWILWKNKTDNSKLSLLKFRRRLAITVLKMHGTQSSQGRSAASTLSGARYDRKDQIYVSSRMYQIQVLFYRKSCDSSYNYVIILPKV